MPTLLLSDDSVTIQRMVALTFASENIAVTMVSDGEQAIARIAQEPPDIVLAGITTPKRSGYDVAAFVKSAPELASIPVLLLAGAFEPVDQARAEQVRCDGVLVKPFDPQQVVARVKELIGGAAKPPVATAPAAPWPAERVAPPPAGESSGQPTAASEAPWDATVDDYFERLDAAFAHRSANPRPPGREEPESVPTLDSVLEPPSPKGPSAPEVAVTDALVTEVTRRVVERLGPQTVRDVVADVVADVAERLIREEIARIRSKS